MNPAYIRNFLRYFFPAGSAVELRVFVNGGSTVSGKYTDFAKMAEDAMELDAMAEVTSVFFTINRINADKAAPIAGAMNTWTTPRVKFPFRTTADGDVSHRNAYFLDFDPVRPSGVCSTDEEKHAAWNKAAEVVRHLTERGWPEPLLVDSGNGWHVYYRADGCDPASRSWERVLRGLSQHFSDERVKIDTVVGNPSRISRLPGSLNRKGANTPERPHRRCLAVQVPQTWEVVPHQLVFKLAESFGPEPAKSSLADLPPLAEDAEEQLQEFMRFYNLAVANKIEKKEGITYYYLSECPFVGRRHDQAKAPIIVLSDTAVGFRCLADGCGNPSFADLRHHLEQRTGRRCPVTFYQRRSDEDLMDEIEHLALYKWGVSLEDMACTEDRILTPDDMLAILSNF